MSTLTVTAPDGAHFDFDEVKTAKGTQTLGPKPLLVWDNVDAMRQFYGDEGVLSVLDGTSLRVSFQGIARRFAIGGKTDDEIAKAELEFRPGRRVVGEATPASKAARAAKNAVESGKVSQESLDKILAAITSGKLSDADIAAL